MNKLLKFAKLQSIQLEKERPYIVKLALSKYSYIMKFLIRRNLEKEFLKDIDSITIDPLSSDIRVQTIVQNHFNIK